MMNDSVRTGRATATVAQVDDRAAGRSCCLSIDVVAVVLRVAVASTCAPPLAKRITGLVVEGRRPLLALLLKRLLVLAKGCARTVAAIPVGINADATPCSTKSSSKVKSSRIS